MAGAKHFERAVLSGGPHSGKTTTFDALKSVFPDATFLAEPAERVITRERALQAADPSYEPRLPWIDYATFGPAVLGESVALEATIPPGQRLVIQDRSLIDTIAYARLGGQDQLIPKARQLAALSGYAIAFFCDPIDGYTQTDVRVEDHDLALHTHGLLREAYDEFPIHVVELPAVSLGERLDIIKQHIWID